MLEAVLAELPSADALVMAAAPADFQAEAFTPRKIKRAGGIPEIRLALAPDILAAVRQVRTDRQVVVAFAAETDDLAGNARRKLLDKGADLLVANDVSRPGIGFDSEENEVLLLDRRRIGPGFRSACGQGRRRRAHTRAPRRASRRKMPARTRRPRRNDALSAALGYFRDLGVREVHLPKRTVTPAPDAAVPTLRTVPRPVQAVPSTASAVDPAAPLPAASSLSGPALRPGGRRLVPALRALPDTDADRLRGRHGPEPAHVRGRGSRRRRGRHGRAVRRPGGTAPDEDGRVRDGSVARPTSTSRTS